VPQRRREAKQLKSTSPPECHDVGFVAEMVKMAMTNSCIDQRRVYASQSNGGMMTEQVGEDARTASLFAAGVQVSGLF
jgi:poly(3-hydroxybutyrate) depolymerase